MNRGIIVYAKDGQNCMIPPGGLGPDEFNRKACSTCGLADALNGDVQQMILNHVSSGGKFMCHETRDLCAATKRPNEVLAS